jgi:trehalose 6-phosphate phosphatase
VSSSRPAGDALAPLVAHPEASGVVLDFDGTLSPIVTEPAQARPGAGAAEVLVALVARYAVVAVVSGRPVDFLVPLVPEGVVLSGLYGLEVVRGGERHEPAQAGVWRQVVAHVSRRSTDHGPEGMVVEPKGMSLTLHYRAHPEAGPAVAEWARRQAARSGLVARPAKMSVELHPPIDSDKGTALEQLVDGLGAVLYAGDDRGDLPAFDALDRLAARGVATVRVAVAGAEAPSELVARADLVVDDPAGLVDLLRTLVPAAGAG